MVAIPSTDVIAEIVVIVVVIASPRVPSTVINQKKAVTHNNTFATSFSLFCTNSFTLSIIGMREFIKDVIAGIKASPIVAESCFFVASIRASCPWYHSEAFAASQT